MVTVTTISGAQWELGARDEASESALAAELRVSPLTARLLCQRGYADPKAARKFLNPSLTDLHDPTLLPDFQPALAEILKAKESGELIFIHGDYDVDGMTSAALLSRFLRRIGCNVMTHVPHRIKEGYGINVIAVERAREAGAKLFLTCDCGSGAIEQIKLAKSYGMRVVVTDHHELHDEFPDAEAFINPHRTGHNYPFKALSGVGVAFKFCQGVAAACGISVDAYYRAYLDLVTLGTVADVMPLVGENRILVAHGCARILESKKPGLQALLRYVDLRYGVTARTIGFQLGPRLNAAGRIDDAALSLELLLSEDAVESDQIAAKLEAINIARRAEQDRIIEEAKERVESEGLSKASAIVMGSDTWHPGIIGLVAGRLAEAYHRPAFVMTYGADGKAKGSARTIPGYHLADALKRVTGLLETHGGHELAAGFSAKRENVEAFRLAMQDDARTHIPVEALTRKLYADAETTVAECNLATVRELEKLAPFGADNPEPRLVAHKLTVEKCGPMPNKPQHLKMQLRGETGASVEVVAFGVGECYADVQVGETVSALFQPSINSYRGTESVQWLLKDLSRES